GRGTNYLVDQLATIASGDSDGFELSSGVFFSLTGPPNVTALPSLDASVLPDTSVFLISVDPDARDYLHRYPVTVQFRANDGPSEAPNMLSLVPLQSAPLRKKTLYAAVILRSLSDASKAPLDVPLTIAQLAARSQPAGMSTNAFRDHQSTLA